MYKSVLTFTLAVMAFVNFGFSQDMAHEGGMMKKEAVKNITLEQTKGAFSVHGLTLEAGAYQFEIINNNVGKDVGFVIAPVAQPDQHIKEAYVTEAVKNNTSQKTNIVNLAPGEYVYFCPLNETPQYKLTVK
ncbi:cupredoxin domain-containing protein [Phaeodactylibacter sp.]|uniref:cupredoxin domain-containing protein n=1 Tax=Phaeodactylibacter sp. TaxID=1940289 RepID=UPI0025F3B2E7|nr:cupredoxin domain-containing protein [Phaeodactylibacter sp.]MCI4650972.1 cupredoxin domain-containing protein [Phaeodactylibacter sp.]MCI5093973.1 cupredoxin domain-containing protein [Phaeodactylibacter sp.]